MVVFKIHLSISSCHRFEVAKVLFARPGPYHILIGCRGAINRANDAISKLKQLSPNSSSTAEPLSIDITSEESISAAFKQVQEKFGHVDILVNNAGLALDTAVTSGQLVPREGWNQTYDVNVTGTHLFTSTFAPLLLTSLAPTPRLNFITSGLSPRYTLAPAGWPKPDTLWFPYHVSKAAMNMLVTEWAHLLRNDGVAVFNVSPGGPWGRLIRPVGAAFCADVIEGSRDEQAWPPKVIRKDEVQPW
ncbi:NAD(P)-binding protein [Aspergillus novofumigatus IBT 16806]|uniref:NAD(P)-binding protein n=1 Tax=Aspergillus novofumigatus (strain IBT 16806) TaxID=1392255 RepID=A0A2I1C8N7_ASPN1|nr:NAD(P)-binding protein [Aspergillus novofumigatus IBT 16806]PKX93955.1 NAD(P)-binding protein [Aspergillus novofumigatus IBT 16806]